MKTGANTLLPKYGVIVLVSVVLVVFVGVWFFKGSCRSHQMVYGIAPAVLTALVLAIAWFTGTYLPYASTAYEVDDEGVTIVRKPTTLRVRYDAVRKVTEHVLGVIVYCNDGRRCDIRPSVGRADITRNLKERMRLQPACDEAIAMPRRILSRLAEKWAFYVPREFWVPALGIGYVVLAMFARGAVATTGGAGSADPWYVIVTRAILPDWSPSVGTSLMFLPTAPTSMFEFFLLARYTFGTDDTLFRLAIDTRYLSDVIFPALNFLLWWWFWKRFRWIGVTVLAVVSVVFFTGAMFEYQVAYGSRDGGDCYRCEAIETRLVAPWSDEKSHRHPTPGWLRAKNPTLNWGVSTYYGYGLIECMCQYEVDAAVSVVDAVEPTNAPVSDRSAAGASASTERGAQTDTGNRR